MAHSPQDGQGGAGNHGTIAPPITQASIHSPSPDLSLASPTHDPTSPAPSDPTRPFDAAGPLKASLVKEEAWHYAPMHMLEQPPAASPAPGGKRRRTVLSIAEKAEMIRRLHKGESQRHLALEYGIGTSTVSDVKKHEAEILRYVETNGDYVAMTRRKLESGAKSDVEEAVFSWLLQEVGGGREVAGAEVMARARAEHVRLRGSGDFRASSGWLERFKRRYNIKAFKPGEEESWRPLRGSKRRGLSGEEEGGIVRVATGLDDNDFGRMKRNEKGNRAKVGDKALITGRKKVRELEGRQVRERASKGRAMDFIERVLESNSSSIKQEADIGEFECEQDAIDDEEERGVPHVSLQPLVSLEEGHPSRDFLPSPVQDIPSAAEASGLLARALVWAAAQPDTTPQELFVIKTLQTRAALICMATNL